MRAARIWRIKLREQPNLHITNARATQWESTCDRPSSGSLRRRPPSRHLCKLAPTITVRTIAPRIRRSRPSQAAGGARLATRYRGMPRCALRCRQPHVMLARLATRYRGHAKVRTVNAAVCADGMAPARKSAGTSCSSRTSAQVRLACRNFCPMLRGTGAATRPIRGASRATWARQTGGLGYQKSPPSL